MVSQGVLRRSFFFIFFEKNTSTLFWTALNAFYVNQFDTHIIK